MLFILFLLFVNSILCKCFAHVFLEQARAPFAKDDLPTVGLRASSEENIEKRLCLWSCATPDERMATDRTVFAKYSVQL